MKDLAEIKPEYEDSKTEKQTRAEDIFGKFKPNQIKNFYKTVSVAPSSAPHNFLDQIQIYRNASVAALYVYDTTNAAWYNVGLTI